MDDEIQNVRIIRSKKNEGNDPKTKHTPTKTLSVSQLRTFCAFSYRFPLTVFQYYKISPLFKGGVPDPPVLSAIARDRPGGGPMSTW